MSKKSRNKKKTRSASNAAKRRAQKHKGMFDPTAFSVPEGVSLFVIKDEKPKRLDILPYAVKGDSNPYADKGELHYERTYYVHRGVGAEKNSYVCPSKTAGLRCPICEWRTKATADPDADEETIKKLAPKERQLFNVIDLKEKDKGIQLWDISYHLFGKRLDAEIRNADEDENYDTFADLEGGSTLKMVFSEQSFNKQPYFEIESLAFKARNEDYDDDILDQVADLDDAIILLEYDELKKILLQTTEDEDEDGGKKKKATKKKTTKKKATKKKDEDEDDDDDADDDLDDDDDVDDDTDDDDNDDDVDDDDVDDDDDADDADDDDDDDVDDDDDADDDDADDADDDDADDADDDTDDDDDDVDDDDDADDDLDDDDDDWDDDDDDEPETKKKATKKKATKKKTTKKKATKKKK